MSTTKANELARRQPTKQTVSLFDWERCQLALLKAIHDYREMKMKLTGAVEGTVKDKKGDPQMGAEITVDGTELTAIANMDGSYSITDVPAGVQCIIASMVIGHATKEVKVPAGGSVTVDLVVDALSG